VIGVDVGGTCTDCVVLDDRGELTICKTFSTPGDFSKGVLEVISIAAGDLGTSSKELLSQTKLFLHACTIPENIIITGDLAPAGLLVTSGFEDTLSMMRGGYAEWVGRTEVEIKNVPYVRKPEPVIALALTRPIRERVDARGDILINVDESEIDRAVQELVASGIESIGVSFLWSFANPANEKAAAARIKKMHPDLYCTLSHEIAPVIGEFERTQTVALNVRMGPKVAKYLEILQARLSESGYHGSLLIMQAHGGLLASRLAAERPIAMIESGPIGGLVGTKALGETIGFKHILGVDMGGTTFKAGVISDGLIDYAREPMVLQYPYASPKMNMESIGVAGGSIVRVDPESHIPQIGPQSAGADPGPVCYDRGGTEPTITDVDLILGYLNERYFMGGRAGLTLDKALAVFKSKVADPLGMTVQEAAGEVYRLANSMIYDMLHKLTVERGLDPRAYALFSSGGTAGMHVATFGPKLGVQTLVIPHSASVQGAMGLVTSDVAHEEQLTRTLHVPVEPDVVNAIYGALTARVTEKLADDGFAPADMVMTRAIDMRYRRQVHVVTTPVEGSDPLSAASMQQLLGRFDNLYEDRYGQGSAYSEAGVDMVNFRVRGVGLLAKPRLTRQPRGDSDPRAAFAEVRSAYFSSAGKFIEAQCYEYEKLRNGNVVEGPALIWTPITTIVLNPGQIGTCDEYLNLRITWN
jgi:N-methylhydantoinase A